LNNCLAYFWNSDRISNEQKIWAKLQVFGV